MGYVYLITNTINGTKYVGQSKCDNIETRWEKHRRMSEDCIGRYLLAAYKKYGVQNFKFQIICICFDEACDSIEEYYIKKYNTLAPNGYNLKPGGKSTRHHEDTKKLISQRLRDRMTDEIRQQLRERALNSPNTFKKFTDEQKIAISDRQKKYWANLSIEERNIISNERKNRQFTSEKVRLALQNGRELAHQQGKFKIKKVGKYDKENNLLMTYESISEASRQNNISHSSISRVCLGKPKYKVAAGFIWKFIE